MGKHERQLIEGAEKIIVKILNSQKINNFDRKNRWLRHVLSIAEKIKQDFLNITLARHLGNRYDDTGDILIISNEEEIFIEVKMSDTKLGIGTKANISQNALTENHLFVGKTKSWSKFRQGKKHEKWVVDYLNQFGRYPKDILEINNPVSQKEEKARYLRGLKGKKNKVAIKILDAVRARDKKEKMEYLNYLSKREQHEEMVRRFLVLIILGIHRKEVLAGLINNNDFFEEAQNLFIYYANISKDQITVRRENAGRKVKEIIKEFSGFKIVFPKGVTHCKIIGTKAKSQRPLLQIVFHWKNIAQGIKTPCLNIFDLAFEGFNTKRK